MITPNDAPKFMLRLPADLHSRIKGWAVKNSRSMNAEIVSTLEEKYPKPVEPESVNERLADAAFAVAASWTAALKAIGQDPSTNKPLQSLLKELEDAGRI